jgi:modulator of FtsH protease HflC
MSNKTTAAALLVAIVLIVGWSTAFVVDETEQVIITQFGKFKRSISEPGLYFKVPLAQTIVRMERRILSSDAPAQKYLTLDKKRLVADPITRWRIVDPLKYYMTVHDESGARARLDDIVLSEMRREISSHNFGDIVGNARDPLMKAVAERTHNKAKDEFGIVIIDVRIKRADLPTEVQESVFSRMRAERERIGKKYRSEGEEEAAMIRADTDKEKTILLAKAYEAAQKLQGEGDAISTKIYADAYGKDPEFYAFLRSLDVYEEVINAQTSVVLSTDSALFKYLDSPNPR